MRKQEAIEVLITFEGLFDNVDTDAICREIGSAVERCRWNGVQYQWAGKDANIVNVQVRSKDI